MPCDTIINYVTKCGRRKIDILCFRSHVAINIVIIINLDSIEYVEDHLLCTDVPT